MGVPTRSRFLHRYVDLESTGIEPHATPNTQGLWLKNLG
jgi:hypothetical protein